MITELNTTIFRQKLFAVDESRGSAFLGSRSAVIEFYVTWCPHCQAMAARYEAVAQMHDDIDFYRVELESYPEIGEFFNIESFPTFLFIPLQGRPLVSSGEVSARELENQLRQAFRNYII